MSSSRGGTPYPNSPGTHFVQDIQSEISNYFTESLLASKSINDSNVAKIVSRRDKLNSLLTELQDRIFYLTQNFEKNSTSQIDAVTEQLGAEIVRSDIDIKSTGTGKGIVTTAKNIISNIISKIKGTY
jgi:superfamily II helicase